VSARSGPIADAKLTSTHAENLTNILIAPTAYYLVLGIIDLFASTFIEDSNLTSIEQQSFSDTA